MIQYTLIIETKDGNELKGMIETDRILEEDDLVTVKTYKGYCSGYILEILREKRNGAL